MTILADFMREIAEGSEILIRTSDGRFKEFSYND